MNSGDKDPNGKDQHEAGAKLDAGKPDCDLLGLFSRALWEVARVGTAGAAKYSRGGWQFVDNGIQRYSGAKWRHMLKGYQEEYDTDEELLKYLDKPVLHAAQEAWNALAKLELMLREKENGRGS